MWPFSSSPKRTLPPKPVWLKWLLVLFIAYVFVMANAPRGTEPRTVIENAKEKITNNPTLQLSGYKDKLFPEYGSGLRIQDMTEGTGAPAVCGQTVKISYETFLAQGNPLSDHATIEKPLEFTIGDGRVMPVFDRSIIGMKANGKRSVIAPPLMSYGLEDYRRDDVPSGASVRFEVALLSVSPALPSTEDSPYRIAEIAVGNGPMIICGEPAQVTLTAWNLSGHKIYESKEPITITPGKSEVMLGLEHGIIGMLTGGTRLLIIPPAFQQKLGGGTPRITLPFPKDQTVMVEVRTTP